MIATLPDLSVEVAGTRLTMSEMQTLAEIRVQQRLSAPSVCEIIFRSSDVPTVNAKAPPVGSALRISIRGGTEALTAGTSELRKIISHTLGAERRC